MKKGITTLGISLLLAAAAQAQSAYPPMKAAAQIKQEEPPKNWFNLDNEQDGVKGMSVERAYAELLKGKKGRTVIVAVIDSGVDIEHEDLQGHIWTNEDEIPGNGIDDDKNGYIDDVHGWNFIGGKDGKNVYHDTYELTRLYAAYNKRFKEVDPATLSGKDKEDYDHYLEIKKAYEQAYAEAKQRYQQFMSIYEPFADACKKLKERLKVEELTPEVLNELEEDELQEEKATYLYLTQMRGLSEADMEEYKSYFEGLMKYGYNPDFNPRTIVGDNPEDINDRFYGNADVEGPDATHGTHVAGIIAAVRGNGIGMDGVADNVLIMPVRVVPDGDERDKDVALGIRYAVDNGAHIINMSFGKAYSPHKEWVDEAIRYAESKGVLLVHAAGNDGKNTDVEPNFPTKFFGNERNDDQQAQAWLEVGASSWANDPKEFVASFSNYGDKTVDVFAPGVAIYSTVPNNQYEDLQGTSMASPATAGVAALIMSYYPELTARQVKDIIMQSVVKYEGMEVNKPGSRNDMIPFDELCISDGIVNAYKAVQLAEEMTQGKSKKKKNKKKRKNKKRK
jgi:subtilisin family serine protease